MRVEAIVSQQSNEVDDHVDVFLIVRFVGHKHLPCVGNGQITINKQITKYVLLLSICPSIHLSALQLLRFYQKHLNPGSYVN